jgi:hypothetical protein
VKLSTVAAVLAALADTRRLELLSVVAKRQQHGTDCSINAIAAELGLDLAATLKEAIRLSNCGLLNLQRHSMSVDLDVLRTASAAVESLLPISQLLLEDRGLARFFKHGRLTAIPENINARREVAALVTRLLPRSELSEHQVNELLGQVYDDHAALRRLLVDEGLVTREGSSRYQRVD